LLLAQQVLRRLGQLLPEQLQELPQLVPQVQEFELLVLVLLQLEKRRLRHQR
jgi:hypothetical protein